MLLRELNNFSLNRKSAGLVLLVLSAALLIAQFWLAFATAWLPKGNDPIAVVINLIPYALFLLSLYMLFGDTEFPRGRRGYRLVGVALATIALAGGSFLILVVLCLFLFGPGGVEFLFANLTLILGILALTALPIVQRRLR